MIIKIIEHIKTSWFWILVGLFLMVFFTLNGHPIIHTFYFISFLLPVIIATSYYVNERLIPEYLVRKKKKLFLLYSIYTIIISLYLQYLIVFIALYIFTYFQIDGQNIRSINISSLSLSLYVFVLIKGIIEIILKLNQKEIQIQELKEENKFNNSKQAETILVRYNRTNHPVQLEKILFIESLSDYIKIVTESGEIITKEKISKILDRLPATFIRTHRSFIINIDKLQSYNREFISLENSTIPISRTYKKEVLSQLEKIT